MPVSFINYETRTKKVTSPLIVHQWITGAAAIIAFGIVLAAIFLYRTNFWGEFDSASLFTGLSFELAFGVCPSVIAGAFVSSKSRWFKLGLVATTLLPAVLFFAYECRFH